jgi:hypothetical protein
MWAAMLQKGNPMTTQEAVRRLVETTVNDLAACLGGIVRQAVREAVEAAESGERNGTVRALVKPLRAEFAAVVRSWEEAKARELLESAGLLLMLAGEKLATIPVEAVLGPANPEPCPRPAGTVQRLSRVPSPKTLRGGLGNDPAQPRLICIPRRVISETAGQGPPSDAECVGEHERNGGQQSGDAEGSDQNNGTKPPTLNPLGKPRRLVKTACGVLTERSLVAFLYQNNFVEVPHHRGERTFVHRSDQRISVPPRHGGDRDIPRGTAQNILRRLREILQVPLKLVAGDITEVCERAALP